MGFRNLIFLVALSASLPAWANTYVVELGRSGLAAGGIFLLAGPDLPNAFSMQTGYHSERTGRDGMFVKWAEERLAIVQTDDIEHQDWDDSRLLSKPDLVLQINYEFSADGATYFSSGDPSNLRPPLEWRKQMNEQFDLKETWPVALTILIRTEKRLRQIRVRGQEAKDLLRIDCEDLLKGNPK